MMLKSSSSIKVGACSPRQAVFKSINVRHNTLKRTLLCRSEQPEGGMKGVEMENPDSEAAKKKAEAEALRAAEQFMVVGSGEATCKGCGYEYSPAKGDPEWPVAKGTKFQDTPADYQCPTCGAPKAQFESRMKVVAGFAANQGYGLGTNSMTGEQKTGLIYGALAFFFVLFLLGYAMD